MNTSPIYLEGQRPQFHFITQGDWQLELIAKDGRMQTCALPLIAFSRYIRNILKDRCTSSEVIDLHLPDFSFKSIIMFINFVNTGYAAGSKEDIFEMVNILQLLEIGNCRNLTLLHKSNEDTSSVSSVISEWETEDERPLSTFISHRITAVLEQTADGDNSESHLANNQATQPSELEAIGTTDEIKTEIPDEEQISHQLKCTRCPEYLQNSIKLQEHELECSKIIRCELCFEKCDDLELLLEHQKENHYKYKGSCSKCKKVLYTEFAFDEHLCWGETPNVQCTLCKRLLRDEFTLKVHKRQHTNPPIEPGRTASLESSQNFTAILPDDNSVSLQEITNTQENIPVQQKEKKKNVEPKEVLSITAENILQPKIPNVEINQETVELMDIDNTFCKYCMLDFVDDDKFKILDFEETKCDENGEHLMIQCKLCKEEFSCIGQCDLHESEQFHINYRNNNITEESNGTFKTKRQSLCNVNSKRVKIDSLLKNRVDSSEANRVYKYWF